MAKTRILLADDHEVVRSGLATLLAKQDGLSVIHEVNSGELAYQSYSELEPDLLIMDMTMPGIGGLEALRRIRSRYTQARVIMFSMHENATLAMQAMSAGAMGYVSKAGDSTDILTAIRQVMSGNSYLSTDMAQKIALQSVSGNEDPTQRLTAREFEVFRLLAEGLTLSRVANQLNLEPKTVANYQTILKNKLGFSTSTEMVRLAIKYGVINSH